ncbi:MAG: hypothetical protein JWO77_238 [Ilumatobacteraceae bacterium]|nr:hypothetical protein [Ilumatobacteraceae bacterium]
MLARYARNKHLSDACYLWAFATLTRSPEPERSTTSTRAAGDTPSRVLRNEQSDPRCRVRDRRGRPPSGRTGTEDGPTPWLRTARRSSRSRDKDRAAFRRESPP